jgi:triphosphatase
MTESVTGLKQETTAQMAQRICAEQFAAILIQEPGVKLGDVEAIHDMRVATRRLRVTLINFAACWTKAEREQLKSWLQNLADALGEVRDLDVLMDALKPKLNQSAAPERPLFTNLIERLRQQRKRRFQALLVFLDSEAYLRSKDEVPRLLAVSEASPTSPKTNG